MKHNNISEKDYNISEQDLLNKQDLSHHTENNTKENTEIKSPNTSETKEVPYPRRRKFKSLKDIEHYIIKAYYKHYAMDFPNYILKQIIYYKISKLDFLAPIKESKYLLGTRTMEGSMLFFNNLIHESKRFKYHLEKSKEDIPDIDKEFIEKLIKSTDRMREIASEGYEEAKKMYKITKREEKLLKDIRRN